MLIREMDKDDMGACVDISYRARRESWERYEKEFYPEKLFEEELKRYSKETFSRFIEDKNSYAFVSVEKQGVIGLAIGRIQEGGISDLSWICTDPLFQRKGAGKELLSKVNEYCKGKGCHKIFAYTFPFLTPAVNFYLKSGFILEAYLRKHWYQLDFLIMSKWLE
jgi:RimJ/RimL family protein N-acetyltransferase